MIIPGSALHESAAVPPGLRLMLSREAFERTGLMQLGSRASERYLFKLDDGAPPVESVTLKITVEVSLRPVPLSPIVVGVAETNWIEPIAAAAIDTVPVAVRFWLAAVALAVMVSVPLQPFAT